MKTWIRIAGTTLAGATLAGALFAGGFVYSGWYDISATEQHTGPVYRLLDTAMRRAIKVRVEDITVPDLQDKTRVENGLRHYRRHCVQCHGAPGVAPESFALGLMPAPASLVATAREWTAAEIYWVVRHGIKMSGMPAWQYRMSDAEMWDVVAFTKALPTISPMQYAEWNRRVPDQAAVATPAAVPGSGGGPGDAEAGRRALQQYLCATCHAIPGVVGATRHVGPPLAGIASRQYIAGVLPNTPANMAHWIRYPTTVDPLSAMPDLGVTEQDARDIAAFLYTLDKTE